MGRSGRMDQEDCGESQVAPASPDRLYSDVTHFGELPIEVTRRCCPSAYRALDSRSALSDDLLSV